MRPDLNSHEMAEVLSPSTSKHGNGSASHFASFRRRRTETAIPRNSSTLLTLSSP